MKLLNSGNAKTRKGEKRGVVVGLKAKGKGKVDLTGFVLQPEGLIHA